MEITPFAMERWQSLWEHRVEVNLSESGVEPLAVDELLDGEAARAALLGLRLGYPQTNGTVALRETIAGRYPGATAEHVLVTTGCAEANFLSLLSLVEAGDEVVITAPNYMQTWGLAEGFGARVVPWPLVEDRDAGRWRPDLDALAALVGPKTRLILLCNPNNPTGSCLDGEELDAICALAARHGAWVLADEVYRGAELAGGETPSLWGRYPRALVTCGLSKAYGLPGLRIGWIVGPPARIAALWAAHDYTTIAPGLLNDHLAAIALGPARERILARTRGLLHANLAPLTAWLDAYGDTLSYLPPRAGAMLFLRYRQAIGSSALVERLRREQSVLVVPGDHYGMDGYLRLGYGYRGDHLRTGLERLQELLAALPA